MKVTKHTYINLITPAKYAVKMGVTRKTVHDNIHKGNIEVTLIGIDETIFIDFKKYQNFKFDESKSRF